MRFTNLIGVQCEVFLGKEFSPQSAGARGRRGRQAITLNGWGRLLVAVCWLPAAGVGSCVLVAGALLLATGGWWLGGRNQQAADSRQKAAVSSRQQAAGSRQQAAGSRQQAASSSSKALMSVRPYTLTAVGLLVIVGQPK